MRIATLLLLAVPLVRQTTGKWFANGGRYKTRTEELNRANCNKAVSTSAR